MRINSFTSLINSEKSARRYVLDFCWKNHQRFCPRCRCRKLYALAKDKRRCTRCGYTFHDFSRRFVNACAFGCREWLWCVKLFELEIPHAEAARQMGLSLNTAAKAYSVLRRAILANALDGPLFLEAGLGREHAPAPDDAETSYASDRTPVFGVIVRSGWAFVDYLPDISPPDVRHYQERFHLQAAALGSIVYTAPLLHYQTMLFRDPNPASQRKTGPGLVDSLPIDRASDFWRFVRDRLKAHPFIPARHLPLRLKELEFRYNHRNEDLFEILTRYVCSFVPHPAP